jgi:phosphatidylglycerophosphate synthase
MTAELDHCLILADESAHWEIGGLRQLERLLLELNEFAKSTSPQSKIGIVIFWRPDIPIEQRWQPPNEKLTHCEFLDRFEAASSDTLQCVLSSRLVVKRHGLQDFLHDAVRVEFDESVSDELHAWQKLWQTLGASMSKRNQSWRYIVDRSQTRCCERWLLRGSGKTRDGLVSRHLNRPISRTVTRFLLKTPMTPNAWTLLITLFPAIGFALLIRGDYIGFVSGAALYQLHSILDGCDGEIARAKYLDSQKGPGLDAFGDLAALLLFTLGLGLGLFRATAPTSIMRWIFLAETILAFVLIASRLGPHAFDLFRRGPAAVVSSEHDESLRRSGDWILGARLSALAFELTKRDMVFLAFLVLAVFGVARWNLHLLFIYALVTTILLRHGRRHAR